jgi:hypothetical protein
LVCRNSITIHYLHANFRFIQVFFMRFSKVLSSIAAGFVASFCIAGAAMAIPTTFTNTNNANCASGVNGSSTNNILTKKKATATANNVGSALSSCTIDQNTVPGSLNVGAVKNANVTNGVTGSMTNNIKAKGAGTTVDVNNQIISGTSSKVGQITTGIGVGNTSNAGVTNGANAGVTNNIEAKKGSTVKVGNEWTNDSTSIINQNN